MALSDMQLHFGAIHTHSAHALMLLACWKLHCTEEANSALEKGNSVIYVFHKEPKVNLATRK